MVFHRIEDTRASVAFLYVDDEPSDPKPVGTCFFVDYYEKPGGQPIGPYLVTAKHVWKKDLKDKEAYVRVWSPDGEKVSIPLKTSKDEWLFHEDKSVDLAVQVWTRDRWYGHAVDLTMWPLEPLSLPSSGTDYIKAGEDAVFVGLMTDFPGERKDLPMLRGGMIGLAPEEEIEGEYGPSDYFAVNVQSYKGNSGAPVFHYMAGFKLMGVLTFGYYEEAKSGQPFSKFNLGVSLVTPIEKLEAILNSDEEKSRRAKSKKEIQGEPLSAGDTDDLTKEAMEAALRRVSRPEGKAVIEKLDEASSET